MRNVVMRSNNRPTQAGLCLILIASIGFSALAERRPNFKSQAGGPGVSRQGANDPIALEPGKPIDRELTGGQRHSYWVALSEGQ